ncbi:MAG: porin family protein [Bacteroidota bacterium]
MFLCLMPALVNAQSKFGLKSGINLSDVSLKKSGDSAPNLVETESVIGFHFGGMLQKDLSSRLSLQTELLYNLKGVTTKNNTNTESKERYHYLSLPVMMGLSIIKPVKVQAGLELSYLLANSISNSPILRILDEDRKLDIGFLIGTEISISEKWGLHARYTFGLTPLTDLAVFDQASFPEVEYSWFNQAGQLSLFYRL